MPTRRDNPDAPVKRSFLSRALSGGSGGSKDGRRKSVVGIEGFKRRDSTGEPDAEKVTRRLSSVAPLPPSLASTDSSLPPSTSSTSLSASHRPPVTRTTSSHSVISASSVASTSSSTFSTTPKRDRDREQRRQSRRISLYDPENAIFPSPPRRSSLAGSGSRSREASVVSISSASSSTGSSARRHSQAPSSSPPPPVPAFPPSPSDATAATYIDYTTPLPSTSSSSSSSSLARPSFNDPFAISPFVKSGTGLGTAQMDELVAVMRRKSGGSLGVGGGGERRRSSAGGVGRRTRESSVQSGYANSSASARVKGKERAEPRSYQEGDLAGGSRTRRQRRGEDSSALGEWSFMRGAVLPPSSSSSSFTGSGRDPRSRETSAVSALSDASFASMHALPSRAEMVVDEAVDEDDLTGAPSMERQETLKALERPWMAALAASPGGGGGKRGSVALPPNAGVGVGTGGTKTVEEVVGQYRGELRAAAMGGGAGRRKSVGVVGEGEGGVGEPPPPIPRLVTPDEEKEPPPISPSPSSPTKPLPYVPFPSASLPPSLILPPAPGANGEPPTPTRIKTIEEIIAEHAGPSYLAKQRKPSASAPPPSTSSLSSPAREEGAKRSLREREESMQSSSGATRSVDSLEEEVRLAARTGQQSTAANGKGAEKHQQQKEEDNSETPRLVQNSRSFSPMSTTLPVSPSTGSIDGARVSSAVDSLMNDGFDTRSPSTSTTRSRTPSTPRIQSPPPLDAPAPSPSPSSASASASASSHERDLALLLKSPRLTRLITLRSPPNSGLTVSLADVGSPTGHPVLVFLGLGSVRYLVALYDEVAASYGLRLICVDRWGLGRTGSVPDSQRGFSEWASVVEELVSPSCLDLSRFSILAHSAGAPYAIASAVRPSLSSSVHGSIHLLAPWISTPGDSGTDSLAGPYRFLKYVPTGVLKTAQAAEWKVQAWRLGKPPSVAPAKGVGYDAKAGKLFVELDEAGLEEERERWAAEAPEEGISSPFAPGNGGKLVELYGPEAGVVAAGPANGKGKGWKLLGGGGGGRKSSPASSPGGEGGLTRSPSSLRPPSMLSKRSSFQGDAFSAASSRTLAPSGLPMPLRRSSIVSTQSGSSSPTTPTRRDSLSSFSSAMNGAGDGRSPSPYSPSHAANGGHFSPTSSALLNSASTASLSPRHGTNSGTLSPITSRSPSPAHLPSSPSPTSASSIPPHILIDGLLRASHAESLRGGGTADLLVLLDSSKRGLGFEYKDLQSPVKVWYGDRDDRISLGSVRLLEREVKERGRDGRVEVKVVEGADHGLMANGRVMLDVLESIASEWDRPSPAGRSSSSSTATPSSSS